MNSLEIVTRAIEFLTPERLPVIFPHFGFTDTHGVGWNQIGTGSREQLVYHECEIYGRTNNCLME